MACNFNMDDSAFEGPTAGLMHPIFISVIAEDAVQEDEGEVVNMPQQPRRGPRHEPQNKEDSSMESVMAHANDLRSFQEFEGYLFSAGHFDSDSDVPEDDSDDDEADVAGDRRIEL